MKKSLCGEWNFRKTNDKWQTATVPGCNFLDLLNNGEIKDPFYGTNEKDAEWVGEADWEYERKFEITDEIKADSVKLVCKQLDTICDVFVNCELVGKGENCHAEYQFDIKKYLRTGENTIRIYFYSPVNYVKEKYSKEKSPANSNGQNGIVHIRKPQCHFGWDWGPVLPLSGITGDIYIEAVSTASVSDVLIEQVHADKKVTLNIEADIEHYNDNKIECEIKVISPDGKELKFTGEKQSVVIENPQLWQTAELSGKKTQPLYTVVVSVSSDGTVIDSASKRIGLRTIELNRKADEYGENFQFVLNGVPLFIKGANYIPADSFMNRFDEEKLKYMIDAVQFSNMNMLRLWGGGYYGSDELYDICDERGILLWQDFGFACQPYPFFDEEFLKNVKNEIHYNVKRLRHHASLAIWCGNNEIETMSAAWMTYKKYTEWTEKFFYQILEPEIREDDKITAFIPGSPCGTGYMKDINSDSVGDTHLWAVWHGMKPMTYYRKRPTRFCSEFGFESLPDIKTVNRFAGNGEHSLIEEVFSAHQKCASGNRNMLFYIASRFRLPENFEDLIYLSQVVQQECISDATEYWRRNRGRCNGAMYWQLNDCWPVCSWAGMDYYGCYKALQYKARHFNAPLSVSVDDGKEKISVVAINDYNEPKKVTVKYQIFDFLSGAKEKGQVNVEIKKLSATEVFVFDTVKLLKKYNKRNCGLRVQIFENENLTNEKTVLFGSEKNIRLPKDPGLEKEVRISENQLEITVKAKSFTRLVSVESTSSPLPLSDNYFDILPGESKTVTMPLDDSLSAEEQAQSITLRCCNGIKPQKSALSDDMLRIKTALRPDSIGNFIYYSALAIK